MLGAGAWGTALANMAAGGHAKVWLWAHDPAHVEAMRRDRRNDRRLPGVALAAEVEPVADIACVAEADHVLSVVPAQNFRETARALRGHLRPGSAVVNCAKGIERETGLYMNQVLADVIPGQTAAALSGPSFAVDLARGLPTAVTLAAENAELAENLCARLAARHFRLYRSSDLIGVEIGGAAKNVLAIACGVVDGPKTRRQRPCRLAGARLRRTDAFRDRAGRAARDDHGPFGSGRSRLDLLLAAIAQLCARLRAGPGRKAADRRATAN